LKGYAFASADKDNTGTSRFYDDDSKPGGSVAEWQKRVEKRMRTIKEVVKRRYGKSPKRTYITGISNGGYLTRYALEYTPHLYDGSVDWEGTLFLAEKPNLFTYLSAALEHYPDCGNSAPRYNNDACRRIIRVGFEATTASRRLGIPSAGSSRRRTRSWCTFSLDDSGPKEARWSGWSFTTTW
jgi:hypothetical protein